MVKAPRGKKLTTDETAIIFALHRGGHSQSYIAKDLKRSRSGIQNVLLKKEQYGRLQSARSRRKVSDKDLNMIIRKARTGKYSSKWIVENTAVNMSARHCRRLLRTVGKLVYRNRKRTPRMTDAHKKMRAEFAKIWMQKLYTVVRIIFSDYKKFTLNGPNALQKCWQSKINPPKPQEVDQAGGGSLMVWGAFSFEGKAELAFVSGKQSALDHLETLQNHLLPFVNAEHTHDDKGVAIFQQDNASIHRARCVQTWLQGQDFETMEWPAKSPDLNPMENVWAKLAVMVYTSDKAPYTNLEQLKTAIKEAWEELSQEYLNSLVNSMESRFKECIKLKGLVTHY